jgi:hypothetical protein
MGKHLSKKNWFSNLNPIRSKSPGDSLSNLNADFISHLANFAFFPNLWIILIASSMVEYLTEHNSLSMKSLTDPCSGNDKLCICLYSELDLLRITEIGEILNVGKGGKWNGLAILPNFISL